MKKVGGVKGGEKGVNVKITVKYNKSWNFYGDKISLICGLKWFHRDLFQCRKEIKTAKHINLHCLGLDFLLMNISKEIKEV